MDVAHNTVYMSQQAAGKAVKAALQKLNALAWGHSVHQLIQVLSKHKPVEPDLAVLCRQT
ncbi:MAG: HEPN domain-containing protein [Pirellulaceae bacterium]